MKLYTTVYINIYYCSSAFRNQPACLLLAGSSRNQLISVQVADTYVGIKQLERYLRLKHTIYYILKGRQIFKFSNLKTAKFEFLPLQYRQSSKDHVITSRTSHDLHFHSLVVPRYLHSTRVPGLVCQLTHCISVDLWWTLWDCVYVRQYPTGQERADRWHKSVVHARARHAPPT